MEPSRDVAEVARVPEAEFMSYGRVDVDPQFACVGMLCHSGVDQALTVLLRSSPQQTPVVSK